MRRDDGVYVGIPECRNYVGIERIGERVCCGNNTKISVAYIKCASRGIMDAEVECHFICRHFEQDFAKARR